MTWSDFKRTLEQNPDRELKFQYEENQFVDASYHITEIKQAPIVSVDCGGVMNSWTEIIVQLWEPSVAEKDRAMKVSKALEIVKLVEKSLLLNPLGVVKIEFGNSKFDTRQMYPGELVSLGDNFTVKLEADFTQCKALTRVGSCGTTPLREACCTPATNTIATKQTLVLEKIGAENQSCQPGGGCC
ncbi:hypothetical protein FEM55_05510 [Dyadobacter sediminis]|uniref:Uncharacterized protein n=2 Tax=Dyadobacter sediminis TaxID=1493691 RepID=A0A5R9KL72_9BACT|nr:hypothetical protein FEM55_05510 [Dyadobacter sediminis]